jgi:signal transduction histidine kinase
MIIEFFKIATAMLFACGAAFSFIDLRSRFERSFLHFGITIMLLCLFTAVDLWFNPVESHLKMTEFQHIIFCFIPPFMLWYLSELAEEKHLNYLRGTFLLSLIMSVFFADGGMFVKKLGIATPTILYSTIFMPFITISIIGINAYIIKLFLKAKDARRRMYLFHIIGFGLLSLCGMGDLGILFLGAIDFPLPAFTIIGVTALGIILTYSFTERLILLMTERQNYVSKIQNAYRELEEARSLSELGKSTAIINHEIRNYTSAITGYIGLMRNRITVNADGERMLNRIEKAAVRLAAFSMDILNFSRSKILSEKNPMNLSQVIQNTIETHYPTQKNIFVLNGLDEEHVIHGVWSKLEQVFVNLFRNSFEAQAKTINVRLVPDKYVVLAVIEDDGTGSDEENTDVLFRAFYSTKKGSGLGMSICRSIIEAHGGSISIVSHNHLSQNKTGLIITLTFPAYAEFDQRDPDRKDKLILVKERIEELPEVIRVLRNVCVNPHVLLQAKEVHADTYPPGEYTIVGDRDTIAEIHIRDPRYRCFSIVKSSRWGLFAVAPESEGTTGVFSEEFVLTNLVQRAPAGHSV